MTGLFANHAQTAVLAAIKNTLINQSISLSLLQSIKNGCKQRELI